MVRMLQHSQDVVVDKDLPRCPLASTNSNRWNVELVRYKLRDSFWYALKNNSKSARILQRQGVLSYRNSLLCVLTERPVLTNRADARWQQPCVTQYRYSTLHYPSHTFFNGHPAFHLHAAYAGFLYETIRITHSLFRIQLIRSERHVRNNQGPPCSSHDCLGVVQHLLHSHRLRRLAPKFNHRHGISNQYHVYLSEIGMNCTRVVVRRQHRDRHSPFSHSMNIGNIYTARCCRRLRRMMRMSFSFFCC
mmetsp:Transcript_3697/g.16254  ORF Transcript_3697/g.16254 Transcript_3697/m.16254 type:complete len:248 (-) Transcript_3697:353-1096(-)